jgi:predicted GIY-YIG superfamily endonuclease
MRDRAKNKGFCVYILHSASTGRVYVGQTNDPDRRLREHNGEGMYKNHARTMSGRPWTLAVMFACMTRAEALRLERAIEAMSYYAKRDLAGVT